MREYQKIPGPFKRETEGPNRNKVIEGVFVSPEFEYLDDVAWIWTEKVDGTNVRVHWDSHKPRFGGRTDNAQMPTKLLDVLTETFTEELLEQVFGPTEVTLYGEGFGAGIQSGGVYRPDIGFALFDVRIGDWWLKREDIVDIAEKLGIEVVPCLAVTTIESAVGMVQERRLKSKWGGGPIEGLVGVTQHGLLNRAGERIVVKIKAKDFPVEVDA